MTFTNEFNDESARSRAPQRQYGFNMVKQLSLAMFFMASLAAPNGCPAQLAAGKPVLSAEPSPASSPAQPATVQPAAAAPGTPPGLSPAYVIGPQDQIMVTVWKEAAFSGPLSVRPDGMISMPLLGDVPAAGLTPMVLSTNLAERLKKYINDPLVTVTVVAINSKRIFLLGEIGKTGEMALTPGMTPLQAIAAAGGPSAYANARHIYILRMVDGKQQKIFYDYKKAVKTGNEQGVTLMPGDTLVVP